MKMRKVVPFVLLIVLLGLTGCDAIAATASPTPVPTPVSDPGVVAEANLVPADHITLSFSLPGTVGEIFAAEGDSVQAGDVLARLRDTENLQAQVAAASLAVLEAQQAWDTLQAQADLVSSQAQVALVQARQDLVRAEKAWDVVDNEDFQDDLDDARIDVTETEQDLEDAQEDLADYTDLDEDHPTRQTYEDDVEEAQQAYDEAVWALETLENQYELAQMQLAAAQAVLADAEQHAEDTRNGVDPDDLALAESALTRAQAQLAAAEAALADATLTAPFDGVIVRADLTEGASIAPGQMAFVLADFSSLYIETNDLTENEVVRISEGAQVTITFDALPDQSFTGEVESISDYFLENFGDITYKVRIRLLDDDPQLRWGMTAEVKFEE